MQISGHEGSGLTLSPGSLRFSPANWQTPQRVTVRAQQQPGVIRLRHTAAGGGYGSAATHMTVTVAADAKGQRAWQTRFGPTVSH